MGAIDEPETGWDRDDEDISDVLKEHKKMRKLNVRNWFFYHISKNHLGST